MTRIPQRMEGVGAQLADSLVLQVPQLEIIPISDSVWEALQRRSAEAARHREAQAARQRQLAEEAVAQLDTVCPFAVSDKPFYPFSLSGQPAALALGTALPRAIPGRRSFDAFSWATVPHRADAPYREVYRPAAAPWVAQHAAIWPGAFLFMALFSLLGVLLYLRTRSYYASIWRALLRVGSFARVEAQAGQGISLRTVAYDALYASLLGYAAWYGLILASRQGWALTLGVWPTLLALQAGFGARLWLQHIVASAHGLLLGTGRFAYMLWLQGQMINRLAWPAVLLLSALYTLVPAAAVRWAYLSAVVLVGLVAILRIVRLVAAFRHYCVPAYYILLYLCALEVIPVLLVGKWLNLY